MLNLYKDYISDHLNLVKAKYVVYDLETYPNHFFGVGCYLDEKLQVVDFCIFNQNNLKEFLDFIWDYDMTLVAFNNHGYDDKMLAGVLFGEDPYTMSKTLIEGAFTKYHKYDIMHRSIDLFKDVSGSLKYNQAVLGLEIKETGVGFDEEITDVELVGEIDYCYNDVMTSVDYFRFRFKPGANSIQNKLGLIENYNLPHHYTRKTDNEIVCELLGGTPAKWETAYDELFDLDIIRDVVSKHLKETPKDIPEMYNNLYNTYKEEIKHVKDKRQFKKLFTKKYKDNIFDLETLQFITKDNPIYKYKERRVYLNKSLGGDHSLNFYEHLVGNLYHIDFGSFYPSMNVVYLKSIFNTSNPDVLKSMLDLRISKKPEMGEIKSVLTKDDKDIIDKYYSGDFLVELTQNCKTFIALDTLISGYKLLLNKHFGLKGSPTSWLFNPKKMTSTTVLGQLLIVELVFRLRKGCPKALFGQSNTDGVIFKIDDPLELLVAKSIVKRYSKEIGISIDFDPYDEMWQSTVNNYILRKGDKLKLKGGALSNYKGIKHIEQANRITNTLSIRSKALVDYLVYGVPVEETVRNEKDITRFQYIMSTNGKLVGNYNSTTNAWDLKNCRLFKLLDSNEKIVKVTKSNVNKVLKRKLDEDDFSLLDKFKEEYEDKKEQISVINPPFFEGGYVTNVTDKLDNKLFEKIDYDFYIKVCEDHIKLFTNGEIELTDDELEELEKYN